MPNDLPASRFARIGRSYPRLRPEAVPVGNSPARSYRRYRVTGAVVAKDIVESGNTSAASVPLALSKLIERREIPSGAPVLLLGFGSGLAYAGQVVLAP